MMAPNHSLSDLTQTTKTSSSSPPLAFPKTHLPSTQYLSAQPIQVSLSIEALQPLRTLLQQAKTSKYWHLYILLLFTEPLCSIVQLTYFPYHHTPTILPSPNTSPSRCSEVAPRDRLSAPLARRGPERRCPRRKEQKLLLPLLPRRKFLAILSPLIICFLITSCAVSLFVN
jgi:hypothetical protein